MGLLDLFDKWIVERGSALVQEKHIAFIREKLVAADKEIISLKEKVAMLTAENEKLKAEKINSDKKHSELQKIIDQLKKDNSPQKAKIATPPKRSLQDIINDADEHLAPPVSIDSLFGNKGKKNGQ